MHVRHPFSLFLIALAPVAAATQPGTQQVSNVVDTGDYEIDSNEVAAVKRAKAKNPGAALYILRVGYPAAYRVGGQRTEEQQED